MARYFNNIAAAKADYLEKNPSLAAKLGEIGADVAVAALPPEYDDTPYRTVIDGKYVNTVGEYKAIADKYGKYY